jgi:hypothetical protein
MRFTYNITTSSSYGFDHNWTLHVTNGKKTKSFYLGQDVKFCSRVLGQEPSHIIEQYKDQTGKEFTCFDDIREWLGGYIVEQLDIDPEKLFELEPWELCCQ